MDFKEAKTRAEKLRKEIDRYRYAYHVLNEELISSEALDSLKKELFDLETRFPQLVTPDSPTQRVGGRPIATFKKIRHEEPMLSFNDAFSEEDMRAWFKRLERHLGRRIPGEFYCELKIDGLAIELVYERGILIQGSTRGDGRVGEDVTQNLRTIEAIPLRIVSSDPKHPIPDHLVVRGEVFITKEEFARVNREQKKKGEKLYANPRNIAAGSLRQLDPHVSASRKLDSFQYAIVTDIGQKKHEEEHKFLKLFGFKTNPHNALLHSLEEVFAFRNYWEAHREQIPYEIDGIVVIYNDRNIFEAGGVAGKAPRAAIAYKFAPKEAETVIENIKVQVGRTGVLTPVAVLRPVSVGGITITHATLHNFNEIKRLGVKKGDTVLVSRAGDVIPQVTKVLTNLRTGKEKPFRVPTKCPVDGAKVIHEGALWRCANPMCGARHREQLYHFVSRAAFDIRGLGAKVIDRFLDEGLITDAADIFSLQKGDIEILDRFGRKSAEKLVEEIEKKKNITLSRFLFALGILHVGEETATLLAKEISHSQFLISKPTDVLKKIQKFSLEDLQNLPDIGPVVSRSIYDWFHDLRNVKFMEKLDEKGVTIENRKIKTKNQRLSGLIFVLTGALSSMSRDEAKEKIRALGGTISESVSGRTHYVVAGSKPGAKYEKAKQLGVKIIDEAEFKRLIR